MKVEIYDPPLCCSSGLCGPTIDPILVRMSDTLLALAKQGVDVERFNLAQQSKAVMAVPVVADLIHKNGRKILPITIVNGKVFQTGQYPSYEDLCREFGIEPLKQKPITLTNL
jgi:arsenite methyltransferase